VIDPADDSLISILRARDGVLTEVLLSDGQRLRVMNIAWGYDDGDEWAHVTTNISPKIEEESIDFFFTSVVALVMDPATGSVLFRPTGLASA
jgi:hypothetical protein